MKHSGGNCKTVATAILLWKNLCVKINLPRHILARIPSVCNSNLTKFLRTVQSRIATVCDFYPNSRGDRYDPNNESTQTQRLEPLMTPATLLKIMLYTQMEGVYSDRNMHQLAHETSLPCTELLLIEPHITPKSHKFCSVQLLCTGFGTEYADGRAVAFQLRANALVRTAVFDEAYL